MKITRVLTLALVALACAAPLVAADPPQMDEKAMMEAMAKIAAPGANHKKLDAFVGQWDTKITMWMAPGAPPSTSTGKSTNSWAMGGRYLEQRFEGSFMEQPFTGLGFTGYDNVTKKWWGTWMDSMSTGIMMSEGTMEGDGTWTFNARSADPMSGQMMDVKEKISIKDADHHTMEMWMPGADGKMFLSMVIDYARAK
ncbi:MAG: DUF1579 domain-containing protein [Acidobacteria bacterium]|nr:DUF1579 domain-containing protein [Acidobacteriota bacterium]